MTYAAVVINIAISGFAVSTKEQNSFRPYDESIVATIDGSDRENNFYFYLPMRIITLAAAHI